MAESHALGYQIKGIQLFWRCANIRCTMYDSPEALHNKPKSPEILSILFYKICRCCPKLTVKGTTRAKFSTVWKKKIFRHLTH